MNENEQQDFGFVESKGRNHRLRRGVYLLPSIFTVANLLCGYYAVLTTLNGRLTDLDNASRAIGFAIVFDMMDGFVARATHTNSEFGKQLDSLADMISFGIAPAFLAFAWGVRGLSPGREGFADQILHLGWWVSFAFVICCAWRLARFNIHGMAPGGSRYFVGMPTPAAAGMVAATVHFWKSPLMDWRWSLAWLVLVAGVSALMVSSVRYSSFKGIPWSRRQHSLMIVLIGLLVWSIVVYSEYVLLLVAASYVASGIALHVVRAVRHRLAARTV